MRIGVVVDNVLNFDKRVLREIEILKGDGHEIFVLCFDFGKTLSDPVNNIKVTRLKINRKVKDLLFFTLNTLPVYEWYWTSHIKKFIETNSIDVLHVHDLYMSRASFKGIGRSKKRIPLILDLHENYPFAVTTYNWTRGFVRRLISKPYQWSNKEREYLGYADKIIVLSDEFKEELLIRYPQLGEKEFCTLPNVPDNVAINLNDDKPNVKPFPKKGPVIFYFGVIAERRGIFNALEVFKELVLDNKSVIFLLIGPVDKKDRKRFFSLIESGAIAGQVKYIPWIDLSELPAYLEISDICIAPFEKNPQHESGVANKIFDYMLGKRPVVASDCRPQKELIEKHNCGVVYRNNIEMKNALNRLLNDKQLAEALGHNGYRAILEEYNSNRVKGKLLSLYRGAEPGPQRD